ncbi:tRNA (guanine-N(7)-)-methyltransferase non-catalytic subunit wdr4-like [Mantella aurantiaca]
MQIHGSCERFAVSRLIGSPGGEHQAVLCDGISGIFLISVSGGSALTLAQYISLPYVPVDLDFEDSASLWVLSGEKENPINLYTFRMGSWQPAQQDGNMKRLTDTIQENWEHLQGTASPEKRFSGLYKVGCDNMAAYLMKKEARLQIEKRKLSSGSARSTAKVQKT